MRTERGKRWHARDVDRGHDARAVRVEHVLEWCLCRRAAGETISDDELCAAHPDLMPELADELRTLHLIERARTSRGRVRPEGAPTRFLNDRGVPADAFPGYQALHEIHRGGQGIIYRAVQESTRRKVALKVLLDGAFAGPLDRARFEREISVLAALRHQNIVTIHDSGSAGGRFYFVMDYIAGQPLDVYMSSEARSIESSLGLFLKICEAVNAAHVRGIIHRDLKPANIRIDDRGEPFILDFGLARMTAGTALDGAGTARAMTLTGQFVGSLPWSAPEQADGSPSRIDTRTDVYALGVLLYQMLTGKFPYSVVGPMHEVVQRIISEAPQSPRRHRPEIGDDLSTIVLTCLAKEQERRYQTAGELGRDVERFLRGEPIEAKRDSAWYMLRKSLRRFRLLLAVVSLFMLLLTTSSAVTWSLWRSAAQREAEARANLWDALVSKARAIRHTTERGRRFHALDAISEAAEIRRNRELRNEMIAALAITDAEPRPSLIAQAGMTVFDAPFERCAVIDSTLNAVSVVRVLDGKTLAELPGLPQGSELQWSKLAGRFFARVFDRTGAPRKLEVWRLPDAELILEVHDVPPKGAFDIASDETTLAVARADQAIHLYDLVSGAARERIPLDRTPSRMAFDPAGRRLALYHGAFERACVLDLDTRICTPVFGDAFVGWSAVWSPDGGLLIGARANEIHVWDVATQSSAGILRGHESMITHLTISPDGRHLLSRSWDDLSIVWDLVTRRPLFRISGSLVAFSPDGSTIGGWTQYRTDGSLTVYSAFLEFTKESVCRFIIGQSEPDVLAANFPVFVNHKPLLLNSVSGGDRPDLAGLAFVDVITGRELAWIPARESRPVLFDPDDRFFVSVHQGLGLYRWPVATLAEALSIGPPVRLSDVETFQATAGAANGRVIALSERLGQATIIQLAEPVTTRRFECFPEAFVRALSFDGRLLLAAAWHGGEAAIWDTVTSERVFDLPEIPAGSGAFSPTADRLITTDNLSMSLWDTSTWQRLKTVPGGYANPCYASDGTFVAVVVGGGHVALLNAHSLEELCTLEPPERFTTTGISVNADCTMLVQMSNRAGLGCIWDLRKLREALAGIGLDWPLPPYAPPGTNARLPVKRVHVDLGALSPSAGQ